MPDDNIELIPSSPNPATNSSSVKKSYLGNMKLLESNRKVVGEPRVRVIGETREIQPAIANLMGYLSTITTNLPTVCSTPILAEFVIRCTPIICTFNKTWPWV